MRPRAAVFALLACAGAAPACAPDESTVGAVFSDEPALAAEYFAGRSFQRPAGVHHDANIDFAGWELNDRIRSRGLIPYGVSIRWSGQIRFEHAEATTLSFELVGRVRLWIDGAPIVDDWTDGAGRREARGVVPAAGPGWRDLRIEWDQLDGPMIAILRAESTAQARAVVPARALRHLEP
jgi:hypothetical protein